MEEVLEFLLAAADAECRARRAMVTERDDKELTKLIRAWEAMFDGIRSGLSRPKNQPDEFFEDPTRVAKGKRTKAPTVFAVARYERAWNKSDLYRAWMGDNQTRPRGEAIQDNLYVAKVEGELKIVAHYATCSTCLGAAKLENGKKCPDCQATGWEHRGGEEIKKLGSPKEVRKLTEPTDPLSKAMYDAIDA